MQEVTAEWEKERRGGAEGEVERQRVSRLA
jgi:hypothetical protein